MHEVLGGELLWTYRPIQDASGWELQDVFSSGAPRRAVDAFRACVRSRPEEFAWFRPSNPEPAQRNRVLEALAAVRRLRPGYFETSALFQEVFRPYGLHEHCQLRVLLCDGPTLLAWFGLLQRDKPTLAQRRALTALVPKLQRRLVRERWLRDGGLVHAGLEVALERIGSSAFVLDHRGRVAYANSPGRELLATDRSVPTTLVAAVQGQLAARQVELTRLHERVALGWLAVLAPPSHVDSRVVALVSRCKLTQRQADVLALVARGMTNASISVTLGISVRTVELHVTAIFDKVGVDCRAALVATIFNQGC